MDGYVRFVVLGFLAGSAKRFGAYSLNPQAHFFQDGYLKKDKTNRS